MANIFLADAEIVLIHLQSNLEVNTGDVQNGDAPHIAWGHFSKLWKNRQRIALISHPVSRFIAVVDATNQRAIPDKKSGEVRKFKYEEAIAFLENKNIAHDMVSGPPRETLKQNLLPQTHPFNCLGQADYILRMERLESELITKGTDLSLPQNLLDSWRADIPAPTQKFSPALLERLHKIYRDDFDQLGYDIEGRFTDQLNLTHNQGTSIYSEWPALFESGAPTGRKGVKSLPKANTNLKPFKNAKVTGKSGPTWMARRKSLPEHFRMLQPEFSGRSRLAHLLACCIVTIRRTEGRGAGLELFHRITKEHGVTVSRELNTRWLVSVCDTFADHGQSSEQRAIAMSGSILVNSVKLFETELQNFYPSRPWPPKTRFRDPPKLFDGLTPFWIEGGDMVTNLFRRLEVICELDPVSGQFTKEAMKRMLNNNTTFKRIHEIWRQPRVDKLSEKLDKTFKDLTKKEL